MKSLLIVGALALLGTAVGCSSSSSSGGSTTSTTMSISGTMGGLSTSSVNSSSLSTFGYIKNEAITAVAAFSTPGTGDGAVSAQSNQCADGSYYRVLCSAWSTPPVAAYGDVSCGGSASGSFTVAGLPKNTDISCAVRKSTDGSTFVAFANLELPAASLTGSTTTISAAGDLQLSISVGTNGTITTTVTSGDNTADDSVGNVTVDATSMTGFYSMVCPSDLGTENQIKCKCMLLADKNGGESQETCVANSAANVTAEKFSINLNVYPGTVGGSGLDLNEDGKVDIAAGGTLYAGTIWGAATSGGSPCSSAGECVSAKSGTAEGLPTMGGTITWASGLDSAFTWPSTVALKCNGGSTVNVAVGTVPGSTATQTQWTTWLRALVQSHVTACGATVGGVTNVTWGGCGVSDKDTADDDAFCVGNFTWNVLQASNVNLPDVRWDFSKMCTESGCSSTMVNTAIQVKGIDFKQDGTVDHFQLAPNGRYVLDQFLPNKTGTGGSMRTHSDYSMQYSCTGLTGDAACSMLSDTTNAYLECHVGEELVINFIPATSGYNVVFDVSTHLRFGTVRGGTLNSGANRHAYSQCISKMAVSTTAGGFLARATKL